MDHYIWQIFTIIIFFNTISAIYTVFKEDRPVETIWAWLLVLLVPFVGFIIYFFLGRRISNKKIFLLNEREAMGMTNLVKENIDDNGHQKLMDGYHPDTQELMNLLYTTNFSVLTNKNAVNVVTDGKQLIESLIEDIKKAQDHIHVCYYIFTPDEVGDRVLDALVERAKAGVEIRFLYDPLGSRKMTKKVVNQLKQENIKVSSFLGYSKFRSAFRVNFRNHRKIVVIDGKIGYIGGYNIAKEYIGKGPLGHWRDTHIRVVGDAVQALQSRFIMDWCASFKADREMLMENSTRNQHYYPRENVRNSTPMQVVSSGPEDDRDQIKMGYLKMITIAKKSLYIQTPYFIPDLSTLEAIQIAAISGVDVRIMVPSKPDHPFVLRATEYWAQEVTKYGAKVYRYEDGFIHAKTITVDEKIASVGTANFDIRSFKLNFEVNSFMYDSDIALELNRSFEQDMKVSVLMDQNYFDTQSKWFKFKQKFSRLLSPVL